MSEKPHKLAPRSANTAARQWKASGWEPAVLLGSPLAFGSQLNSLSTSFLSKNWDGVSCLLLGLQ